MIAHRYRDPASSIGRLRVDARYCVPSDVEVSRCWRERQQTLLAECIAFHSSSRAFGDASTAQCVLSGPYVLSSSTAELRALAEGRAFIHAFRKEAEAIPTAAALVAAAH